MRVVGKVVLALTLVAIAWMFFVQPQRSDKQRNTVYEISGEVDASVARFHDSLYVADLHADPLLWDRNLLRRNFYGHVDLPRLIEGNVSLQVFSAVTKVPRGRDYERTDGSSLDLLIPLSIFNKWPVKTYASPYQRALHQAKKLHRIADKSDGKLEVVTTSTELIRLNNVAGRAPVAAVLSIEGLHAIEGDLSKLDGLYEAGFRMMSPTHFFDNEISGSAHGISKGGLTDLGRLAVARMNELGITIDVSHASDAAIEEILDLSTQPVVASHGGVDGTCESPRNLSDRQIEQIAAGGGVVGIGIWAEVLCGNTLEDFAAAVLHTVRLVGEDYVSLGSDFDGTVQTLVDAANLNRLTEVLLQSGLTRAQVKKIMGENTRRVLMRNLPAED